MTAGTSLTSASPHCPSEQGGHPKGCASGPAHTSEASAVAESEAIVGQLRPVVPWICQVDCGPCLLPLLPLLSSLPAFSELLGAEAATAWSRWPCLRAWLFGVHAPAQARIVVAHLISIRACWGWLAARSPNSGRKTIGAPYGLPCVGRQGPGLGVRHGLYFFFKICFY